MKCNLLPNIVKPENHHTIPYLLRVYPWVMKLGPDLESLTL